jgi:hypothetical protein
MDDKRMEPEMTYVTEIYCGNRDCNARQSEVVTKDHGDNPEPRSWRCPACGATAKVHWRRNLAEHEKSELSLAIARVNVALYERDAVGDLPGSPADVLMLDKLPDSWKCARPSQG